MKRVVVAVAALLALAACDPISGAPNPASDHGPNVALECEAPYLAFEVAILPEKVTDSAWYASRKIHMAVTAVNADGKPVTFRDTKSGKDTTFRWEKGVTTSNMRPHEGCIEYGQAPGVPFLNLAVTLMNGQVGDSMRVEAWFPDDEGMNVCVAPGMGLDDYSMVIIEEGMSLTQTVNCTIPVKR